MNAIDDDATILAAMRHWVERAVIGLNLCPFARKVYANDQIRYVINRSACEQQVLDQFEAELKYLTAADPAQVDTTLLIVAGALGDFSDYNEFLGRADNALAQAGLAGTVQVASFHPGYQFAGTGADDIENYTNRAPYPVLHLLREESVERGLAGFLDPEGIYERNQEMLRRLGHKGWRDWMDGKG